MPIVSEPKIDDRAERAYMGIRTQTPMKGMFKVVDKLMREMYAWRKESNVELNGSPFLRYHVIDMAGEMDIEVGFPVVTVSTGNERVMPGTLPAGRYASLVYTGHGLTGNKTLIEWAKANGIMWDRWDTEKGDAFHCRYEAYLTDPKTEPRKTKWHIEVAIKLAER